VSLKRSSASFAAARGLVGRYSFARSWGRLNRPLFSGVPIIASIKVYHIARTEEASDIEVHGFREPSGRYLADSLSEGVTVADRPLLAESGIEIGLAVCFEIQVADRVLAGRERSEQGMRCRRFAVPALVLNRYPRRRLTLYELLMLVP
jgi:hypothetical protein